MSDALGRILVTGASGQLGSYLLRELDSRGLAATAWSRRPNVELFGFQCQSVDLGKVDEVVSAFEDAKPDVVLHAAAMSSVGACFRDPEQARRINATATDLLARLAEQQSARFVHISTDLVFDGTKPWYVETDCPAPLSVYGHTKAEAERRVRHCSNHLVLRISLLFGPSLNQRPSFFQQQIESLRNDVPCILFQDEWRTPLSLDVAASGVLAAAASEASGTLHLGGSERMSRLEMGQRLARVMEKDERLCQAALRDDVNSPEPRPRDTALSSTLWERTIRGFKRPRYEDCLYAMGLGTYPNGLTKP
ncbi:MAG: SDR family oxidoreductase [Planctomycetota bacterium]